MLAGALLPQAAQESRSEASRRGTPKPRWKVIEKHATDSPRAPFQKWPSPDKQGSCMTSGPAHTLSQGPEVLSAVPASAVGGPTALLQASPQPNWERSAGHIQLTKAWTLQKCQRQSPRTSGHDVN